WDELADQGGERMVKLAAAVKAVAERAVRERFWESVSKLLESNGVRVFDGEVPDDTIGAFYYLGMADISADTVDLSEAETFIENLATLLRNARAIPMYSIGEVAEIIRKMNIEKMDSRADLEFASSVLAQLDRRAAKIFVESDVGEEVVEAILRARKEGVDEEKIVEAVNEVLLEAYRGSIAGKEEVAQYLEKRLFS
ncbi:MAG: hypothetical protein PWP76_644, partial [Candidatus Diapherotrites archaeon]|nr:hypothetical protein [Candidatus Diapherotrites archaeon]